MSAVIKTVTPFINKRFLLKALDALGEKYTVDGNSIITERTNYYGSQHFVWDGKRFVFTHDSSANSLNYMYRNENIREWETVSKFLNAVETEYNKAYGLHMAELEKERLEEEKRCIEEEKRLFVEKQKQQVIEKARQQGFSIKEKKQGNIIKLVLVRNS